VGWSDDGAEAVRRAARWRWLLLPLGVLAVVNVAWQLSSWWWEPPLVVSNLIYQPVVWSAVALCWAAPRRSAVKGLRPIATAVTLWVAGDVIWDIAEHLSPGNRIPIADVLYLAGYPVLAFAVWTVVRRVSDAESQLAALLDGVLVATTAGVLLWSLFGSTLTDSSGLFARAVDLGYPMLDVLLVGCCVWLAFTPARSRQLLLFGGLCVAVLAADVLYIAGTQHDSRGLLGTADAVFPIAYLLGAAACWCPPIAIAIPRNQALQRGRVIMLGVAFAALPVSYAVTAHATPTGAVVAAGAATLAFARMAGAAMSADRRHAELDQAVRTLEQTRSALTREATVDALTGLANRRAFIAHLAAVSRTGTPAVVFCDLDRFKPINDGYGHHVGDQLLVEVAARLQRLDADLVARLGGDEFVLVVDDGEPVRTRVVAAGTLACVTSPVDVEGRSIEVAGSVGVATAGEVDENPERLLRDADLAMYAAKSAGGRGVAHFEPRLSRAAEARTRIEVALRDTIAGREGRFALAWQPIVGADGAVVGKEALLRWWHHDQWHSPSDFVPVAEEAGLLGRISRIVLHRACLTLSRQAALDDPTIVAVNISGRQLTSPEFVNTVAGMIERYGIDPAQLCLEVTEETLAGSMETATARLKALADLGLRLSIDDFGAGATSLAHLRQLPFHYVKLDRAFVASVGSDPLEHRLLADLIQLIHGIGRVVVVEGIETEAEELAARRAGADLFQGFRFGRPAIEDVPTVV
jgi:diguanylate cyclase (GGDEF)-like protein